MDDDYYSIEAIFAENQKIQCTFKQGIPNMGHMADGHERDVRADSGLHSFDASFDLLSKIKPGMKAQVPIWMARTLFFS